MPLHRIAVAQHDVEVERIRQSLIEPQRELVQAGAKLHDAIALNSHVGQAAWRLAAVDRAAMADGEIRHRA